MEKLHPLLRGSLDLLPQNKPVSLLTRHSIREKADKAVVSYRAPLTPEGIELARQWGSVINRPIADIYSSPVGRCVETANAMWAGASQNLHTEPEANLITRATEIKTSMILVEPGCFVQDINIVGPQFLKIGPVEFFNKHINEPLEGLLSPRDGTLNLLDYLRSRESRPGTLVVHVSHDTIIAAFVNYLLGSRQIDQAAWPWMMEGIFLWFDHDAVNWIWRGKSYSRKLDSLI